jgi:serine protease Do
MKILIDRKSLKKSSGFLIVGLLLGLVIASLSGPPKPLQPIPAFALDRNQTHISREALQIQNQFSTAVKQATPAVVSIFSSKIVKSENTIPMDPFLRQFFGEMFPHQAPEQREQGLGSGVIVSENGYIITNNHVVDGAQDVRVVLSDKRELQAKIIGTDPRTDLALLQVESEGLPTLTVDPSPTLEVGEIVFAIGNPFGVGQTVTMGIVSATGRGNLGIEDYEDFIQTDAAINPGNSGGALINIAGELVGINTAIIGSGGNDGIGFAIPAKMVQHVVTQIRDHGSVSRGYLGAYIQDVTPEIASAFGAKQLNGALISDVTPGSPAAQAGVKRGDIITAINGEKITESRRLRLEVASMAPGTTVQLTLIRNGNELNLPVELGELQKTEGGELGSGVSHSDTLRGLTIQSLTPEIRQSLGLPASLQGVIITDVDPSSTSADAGLRRDDVIQEVNHVVVNNPQQLRGQFEKSPGRSILLLVNRGGNTHFVVVNSR